MDADDYIENLIVQTTRGDLEKKVQELLADKMPVYKAVAKAFRANGVPVDTLLEMASSEDMTSLRFDCFGVGGELGERHGRARAENMITELRQFERNFLRAHAPWLLDGAGDDDDEPADD